MNPKEENKIYIELGAPCDVSWQTMPRAGAGRECQRCRHKVHDLAALTPEEILALEPQAGRLCARIEWDSEGRIKTRQGVAQAVLCAILGAATPPFVAQAMGAPLAADQEQAARVKVSRPSGVYGLVRDSQGPLSLADVFVSRYEDAKSARTQTDESGAFSFKDLASGSYHLSFSRRDAHGQIERVDVCEGVMVNIDLQAETAPRRVMAGLMVRPDPPQGRSTPGVTALNVTVRSQNAANVRDAAVELVSRSDAAGKSSRAESQSGGMYYSFNDLPAGEYELKVAAPGFVTSVQPIKILADHTWRYPEVMLCPLAK
jgi:hypothetical protein